MTREQERQTHHFEEKPFQLKLLNARKLLCNDVTDGRQHPSRNSLHRIKPVITTLPRPKPSDEFIVKLPKKIWNTWLDEIPK